jgi:hypothetical protein
MSRSCESIQVSNPNGVILGLVNTTTLSSTATVPRTLILPDISDTIVSRSNVERLSNKVLDATTTSIRNAGATGGGILFDPSSIGNNNNVTLQTSGSASGTLIIPNSGTLATLSGVETFANKTMDDDTFSIAETSTGAQMKFNVDSIGAGNTLLIQTSGAGANTLTLPNVTDTLATRNAAEPLTNKDLTSVTNNVNAKGLFASGGVVDVSASPAPSAGQALIATGVNTATWQTIVTPGTTAGAVTTANSTATTIETIATTSNTVYHITSRIVGRRTDINGQGAGYTLTASYINNGGTLTRLGAVDDVMSNESVSSWGVQTTINGTNILIQVVGIASQTISWKSTTTTINV